MVEVTDSDYREPARSIVSDGPESSRSWEGRQPGKEKATRERKVTQGGNTKETSRRR